MNATRKEKGWHASVSIIATEVMRTFIALAEPMTAKSSNQLPA